MREPTIRKQNIHRNHLKIRLIFFGILALALVIASYFSEYLCPYDPYLQDLGNAKAVPSAAHIFGTDRYGRDMLSRVIVGSKTSIYSTLLLVAFITVLGTMIGVFCAWKGTWVDTVLMRISDVFLAFPGLVFALAVAAALGGGVHNAIIALGAISWPKYARVARSETLAQKETVYLRAAKLSGCVTDYPWIVPVQMNPVLSLSVKHHRQCLRRLKPFFLTLTKIQPRTKISQIFRHTILFPKGIQTFVPQIILPFPLIHAPVLQEFFCFCGDH